MTPGALAFADDYCGLASLPDPLGADAGAAGAGLFVYLGADDDAGAARWDDLAVFADPAPWAAGGPSPAPSGPPGPSPAPTPPPTPGDAAAVDVVLALVGASASGAGPPHPPPPPFYSPPSPKPPL